MLENVLPEVCFHQVITHVMCTHTYTHSHMQDAIVRAAVAAAAVESIAATSAAEGIYIYMHSFLWIENSSGINIMTMVCMRAIDEHTQCTCRQLAQCVSLYSVL